MKYIKINWKYRLVEDESFQTEITPDEVLETEWVRLDKDGLLTLMAGYAWDGASGPAIDTPAFMRGSAVHDGLYQLMRLGLLPLSWFTQANLELIRWCEKDGMSRLRREWVYLAVKKYGRKYMRSNDEPKIYIVA